VIVELEFVSYVPRAGGIVANAYAEALRDGHSPGRLAGYWSVDVGRLNSAVVMWTYDDLAQRERALGAVNPTLWPPSLPGTVTSIESLLLSPARFNGPLEPGTHGAVYEIRIYDYETGSVGTVEDRWEEMVEVRREISPLIGCYSGSDGSVDKWVHIWPYSDGVARDRARGAASVGGIWPPETGEWLVHQENMLVLPAAFSPLK
jgi:hypothetical protein